MTRQKRHAFTTLELIISIAVVISLSTGFAIALSQFVAQEGVVNVQRQALMAAESALNEVRAGQPPSPEDFSNRFRRMSLEITRTPGEGIWADLTHVTVKVTAKATRNQDVTVRLDGYVMEVKP